MFKAFYNALSGNEIAQKYEVEATPSATGGHRYLWKVFNAVHRKSNAQVSVFILDKEDPAIKSMNKTQKEALLEAFRREVTILKQFAAAKPAPNPNILRLFQTFEETKKMLAFVSERVTFSLGNACGHFDNLPLPQQAANLSVGGKGSTGEAADSHSSSGSSSAEYGGRNCYSADLLSDPSGHLAALEVARGAAQVLEALQFGVMGGGSSGGKRRLHLDVGPHSVYVSRDGQWKLGGWGFGLELDVNEASTLCPYFMAGDRSGDGTSHAPVGPRIAYSSPEVTSASVEGGLPSGLSPQADIFSLGLLLAEVYRGPMAATAVPGSRNKKKKTVPILSTVEDFKVGGGLAQAVEHRSALTKLLGQGGGLGASGGGSGSGGGPLLAEVCRQLQSCMCPNPGLASTVATMLDGNPAHRPAANTVLSNPLFHEAGVALLRKLDQLPAVAKRDPAMVSSFIQGQLPSALPLLTVPRLKRSAVLVQILAAAGEVPGLWPFVLPVLFAVIEDPTADIHADRFNQPQPAGLGLAALLVGPNAPLNPGVLQLSKNARAYASQQATLAAAQRASPSHPGSQQQQAPPPAPPEWLPRSLHEVCLHASTVLKLAPKEWVGRFFVPSLLASFGAGVPALAEAALKTLEEHALTLLPLMSADQMRTEAVPAVCKLVVHSQHLSVKVNALKCVASILPFLDDTTVVKAVLPTLRVAREKDHTPAVVMCSLGCYDLIAKRLLPSDLARHLLPGLVPLLDEKSLNSKQFEMVVLRVQSVLEQVTVARRTELNGSPDAPPPSAAPSAAAAAAAGNSTMSLPALPARPSSSSSSSMSSWSTAAPLPSPTPALSSPAPAAAAASVPVPTPTPALSSPSPAMPCSKPLGSTASGCGWGDAFAGISPPPPLPVPPPPSSSSSSSDWGGCDGGGGGFGSTNSSSSSGSVGSAGDPFASIGSSASSSSSPSPGIFDHQTTSPLQPPVPIKATTKATAMTTSTGGCGFGGGGGATSMGGVGIGGSGMISSSNNSNNNSNSINGGGNSGSLGGGGGGAASSGGFGDFGSSGMTTMATTGTANNGGIGSSAGMGCCFGNGGGGGTGADGWNTAAPASSALPAGMPMMGGALSVEEQMAQTQREIDRLQAAMAGSGGVGGMGGGGAGVGGGMGMGMPGGAMNAGCGGGGVAGMGSGCSFGGSGTPGGEGASFGGFDGMSVGAMGSGNRTMGGAVGTGMPVMQGQQQQQQQQMNTPAGCGGAMGGDGGSSSVSNAFDFM